MGEVFRNPDLAGTYQRIAEDGPASVYRGQIAERIVAWARQHGGHLDAQDLAAFMMLNILENFPLARYGHNSIDALHVMIETKKLAYADLDRHVGDPRWTSIPALVS